MVDSNSVCPEQKKHVVDLDVLAPQSIGFGRVFVTKE